VHAHDGGVEGAGGEEMKRNLKLKIENGKKAARVRRRVFQFSIFNFKFAIAILIAFAARAQSTDTPASCEIAPYPAATLLLPYFEVDVNAPVTTALNTVFTVVNTSKLPQVVRATIWTDAGYPAAFFNLFLTGYDAQTISLYEVLARGRFPATTAAAANGLASALNTANPYMLQNTLCDGAASAIPAGALAKLQVMLTTGASDVDGCVVGSQHKNAVGYVTLDVINGCSTVSPLDPQYWTGVLLYDNVITGEYVRMNPDPASGNYAGANPLVHIRAFPEGGPAAASNTSPLPYTFYDRYTPATARRSDRRQPLPSAFAVRFIEGGSTGFLTNFTMWREGVVGPSKDVCAYAVNTKLALPHTSIVRFDEHENPTVTATDGTTASATLAASNAAIFPSAAASGDRAGWMWLSLDNGAGRAEKSAYSIQRPSQNWVIVQMYSEGRYGVDFDATYLANGCTLGPPAAP
jgi:hypothetical protein